MALVEILGEALVGSVRDSFSTMLSVDVTASDVAEGCFSGAELICTIGLAGKVDGSLSLAVANSSACGIVSKMLQMEIAELNDDVVDGMREVVNMIAGGIKVRSSAQGHGFDISLPTVVKGSLMSISASGDAQKIVKCFQGSGIVFYIEFLFKPGDVVAAAPASAGSNTKLSALDRLKAMTAKAG